jgi:hypothetical protein
MNPYPLTCALVRKDAYGFSLSKGLLKGKEGVLLGNDELATICTVSVDQSLEVFILHGPNHEDEGNPNEETDVRQKFPIPQMGCDKDTSTGSLMDVLGFLEKRFELSRRPFDRLPRIVGLEERLVFHGFEAREKKGLATLSGDSFDLLLGLLRAQGHLEVLQGNLSSPWKNIIEKVSQKRA